MKERIDNEKLRDAAIALMAQNGMPLTKDSSNRTKAMLYKLANGETVRIRTCNDHILVAVSKTPDIESRMNIEGTEHLLIVMPEVQRRHGRVIAYFIPTKIVADEAREKHQAWLELEETNASGEGRTRNLWFGPNYKSGNYHETWRQYRLKGEAFVHPDPITPNAGGDVNLQSTIKEAQRRIAQVAGVDPAAVKISVDFAA